MTEFLTSNEWYWRMARTMAQGVLGVIVANIDLIVGACVMDPTQRAVCVAFCMAILSPVMAEIGSHLHEGGELDEA